MTHSTIRQGSTSPDVAFAQQLLENAGFAAPGTGFGPVMTAAVKQFQASKGLPADGVIGPATWAALEQGVQQHNFEDDLITVENAPSAIAGFNPKYILIGLAVAGAFYWFTMRESKKTALSERRSRRRFNEEDDWEEKEAPEIRRRVKRIPTERKPNLKRRPNPLETTAPPIVEKGPRAKEDLIYANERFYKTQRVYREEVKRKAHEQAESTGRPVKVVATNAPGKVLYKAEA